MYTLKSSHFLHKITILMTLIFFKIIWANSKKIFLKIIKYSFSENFNLIIFRFWGF